MQIAGLTKTTLLDFPGHVAATIFLKGCNFRCSFCHNRSLVIPDTNPYITISQNEILSFLKKRSSILEGVCITGGEPTINPELPDFIFKIKSLGYKVKLDTNGTNPQMLQQLAKQKLIDYCAMDIKNSPQKYELTANTACFDLTAIKESVSFLLNFKNTPDFDYEFRTTLTKELHSEEDISQIAEWISGAAAYYLQSYEENDQVIQKGFHAPDEEALNKYLEICRPYIPNTHIRGKYY